jgi:predicted SAM-dependent methyltransferase
MKLHLGGGKRFLPGFTHVDLADYDHIDFHNDISDLSFLKDESVSLIYCSHAFEYFDRNEALRVLNEWRRVMKLGASLTLAVPDFDKLLMVYNQTNDLKNILGPLFGVWEIPGKKDVISHKTVYNQIELTSVLELAGFKNVSNWDWRKFFVGEIKDFDDYSKAYFPHLDFENGIHVSLNLTCTK